MEICDICDQQIGPDEERTTDGVGTYHSNCWSDHPDIRWYKGKYKVRVILYPLPRKPFRTAPTDFPIDRHYLVKTLRRYNLPFKPEGENYYEIRTIGRLLWKHPIRHGIEQEIQKSCMGSRASNNQRIRERRKKEMETKTTPTECKLCDLEASQAPEGNVPEDVWSTLENKLTQMET
jgi:hypothetical protein